MADGILIFGERKFSIARYITFRVSGNRKKMLVLFRDPEESIRIEVPENVAFAMLEIEQAMDPERNGNEKHWRGMEEL